MRHRVPILVGIRGGETMITRRAFCELMLATVLVGATSIALDVVVNDGHPAEDDGEEPQ